MNKLEKLINKYNKILSERYGTSFNLLEDYISSLDSLGSLQCECVCDSEKQYIECEFIRKYIYFKIIEKDIDTYKKLEKEIDRYV